MASIKPKGPATAPPIPATIRIPRHPKHPAPSSLSFDLLELLEDELWDKPTGRRLLELEELLELG